MQGHMYKNPRKEKKNFRKVHKLKAFFFHNLSKFSNVTQGNFITETHSIP